MLNERDVLYAKTKLMHIMNGTERCPDEVSRKAGMILRAMNGAIRGEKSCDWLASGIRIRGFRKDLTEKLGPIAAMDPFGMGALMGNWNGSWKELLDHHYWNDCAPWWRGGTGGRYGATPGEDILIKLIANKC